MNECPDHPVRQHQRFFDLLQSPVDNTWRAKLTGLPVPGSRAHCQETGYVPLKHIELIYGATAQEALDNALIHLMNDALWENP